MCDDLAEYLEALREYTRWVRVPGLEIASAPIPLSNVFVEAPIRASAGSHGQNSSETTLGERQRGPAQPVIAVLRRAQRAAILGEPGQGKSTLLRQFCSLLAEDPQGKVPLLIELGRKRDKSAQEDPYDWLKERLPDPLRHALGPKAWKAVGGLLRSGSVHVSLDAFDELDRDARRQVADLIPAFGDNPVVMTSRPDAYGLSPVAGFDAYHLQTLRPAQIATFAENVCRALATQFGLEDYRAPLQRVRRAAIGDLIPLAGNPLFLSFMCLTATRRAAEGTLAQFPRRPATLIAECVDAFVAWHRHLNPQATWPAELDAPSVICLLAPLALQTFRTGTGQVCAADLERLSKEDRATFFQHLVPARFVEQRYADYVFPLETFREYFAARALAASGEPFREVMLNLHDPAWKQVILYTVGSAHAVRASPIVLAMPSYSRWFVKGIGPLVRIVAGLLGSSLGGPKAIGETAKDALKEYGPALEGPLQRWHARSTGSVEFFITSILRRRSAYEHILARDLRLAALCAGVAKDCPKRTAVRIVDTLVRYVKKTRGSMLAPYRDALAQAAHCQCVRDRLLELTRAKNSEIRSEAALALSDVVADSAVRERLIEVVRESDGTGPDVWGATSALESAAGDVTVRDRLLELTRDDEARMRRAATSALRRLAAEPIVRERVLDLTRDDDARVRWLAAVSLSHAPTEPAVRDRLLDLTRDAYLNNTAVQCLQPMVGDATVRDCLLELTHADGTLATGALQSLQQAVADPAVLERMLEIVQDTSCGRDQRLAAADGLRLGVFETGVRDRALEWTHAADADLREAAVRSLELVAQEPAVRDRLLELATEDVTRIRHQALKALGRAVSDPGVRDQLLRLAADDNDVDAQRYAVDSLQEAVGEPIVRDRLRELLRTSKGYAVRRDVMNVFQRAPAALGRERLLELIRDRDTQVKWAALQGLARLHEGVTGEVLALSARFARYGSAGDEQQTFEALLLDWEQQERELRRRSD